MSVLGNNLLAQYYAQNQGLPFGYEAVEYLESTGTQYIDTEMYGNEKTKVELTAQAISNSGYRLFGSRYRNYQKAFFISALTSDYTYTLEVGNLTTKNTYTSQLQKRKISLDMSGGEIDDVRYTFEGNVVPFQTPSTLIIFGGKQEDTIGLKAWKIWYCKHWQDNILVQYFIPCVRKSDGKPGLYDLCKSICPLTGTPFYINAGTGEFVTP